MRIRRLDVSDAELAVATVREFKGRSVSTADAEAFLADSKHYLVVADDLGAPAGFLLAYRLNRIDRPSAKLFIYELEVAERYRRRKVATSIVSLINDIARRERLMNAFVLTNHSNAGAVAFYKSTGARIANGDDLMFVYEQD
jgi:aminoglycoside 3-N-acetyltransferase I